MQKIPPILAVSVLFLGAACSQGSDKTYSSELGTRISGPAAVPYSSPASVDAEPVSSQIAVEIEGQGGSLSTPTNVPEAEAPDQTPPSEAENVTPPTNVAGSYLYCEEISPEATQPEYARVACSVFVNKVRVAPESLFTSVVWGIEDIPANVAQIQVQAPGKPFDVIYRIRGASVVERENRAANAVYTAAFTQTDGGSGKLEAKKVDNFLSWEPHNRLATPPLAFQGGTESGGVPLYLCRLYISGSVIPGKLALEDTNIGGPRTCYSVDGLNRDISSLDGLRAEVLVTDVNAAKLRWTKFSGTIPSTGLVGGQDSAGNPIYVCRALESGSSGTQAPNNRNGEYTPGYVKPGSRACSYEFFGVKSSVLDFEILEIDGVI